MAEPVYVLGVLVTALCAVLLLRAYASAGPRLLLWSGLCFAGLTISNVLLFVDLVILGDVRAKDLEAWTAVAARRGGRLISLQSP